VVPVSISNFCSDESLRVIRVTLVGGTDFQLRGESNLADIYSMREPRKRFILDSSAGRQHPDRAEQEVF
jgi:hypothetical protein